MARTVTWTPAPGELFNLPETSTNVLYSVSVSVSDDLNPGLSVTGYEANITPSQTILDLDTTGDVTVSADSLAGLFPVEFIDYLLNGNIERVTRWDDLPAAAEDLIEYRPSSETAKTYTLNVTATLSDGSEEQAAYTMVVTQNWTTGRDRLVAEVNARR
ncbi:MAG TPA: hypothetical protein VFX91_12580 [Alcanivorax sp.]|nr:hypothetical protein [Alcanivorax sp.]